MGKWTALLVTCLAVAVCSGGTAQAKRHRRAHAPTPTPIANEAATPAGRPAEAPAAGEAATAPPAATAYAPTPQPGLTGLLDSIFKPRAATAPPPAPAASPAPAAEAADAEAPAGGVTVVPRAGPLRDLVAKHAAANGVPFPLAHAVIMIESKYAARIAHAGNYGLMQIRAQTARGLGFTGSAVGLLDPETNLRFGMKYLAMAYRMAHGDTCGALMRYQSGVATTRMSAANRAYCARARGYMAGR